MSKAATTDLRALRVMRDNKIGVRPLGSGWWPDLNSAVITVEQKLRLSTTMRGMEPFTDPVEAVMFVASTLMLANFP